jgi:hypothetical protein
VEPKRRLARSPQGDFGFGFNPVADAIRVVEEENLSLRFSPNSGNSLGLDGNLNPGDPRIVAADYTSSFDGATSTTLYDVDSGSDRLLTQGSVGGAPVSPNTGNLIDVGPLGVDTTDNAGLDIAQASGTAFASFELAGSPGSSVLHRLDLSTGAGTLVGTIAGGLPLESLSVVPASVLQFPSSATAESKSSGQVQIAVTRTGPANRTATVAYSLSTGSGGMLTFAPGDYQENITVPTTGNVTITLSGESANAVLGPQSSTSVVVVDDTAQTPRPSPGPGSDITAPVLLAKAGALKRGVLRVRFSCTVSRVYPARQTRRLDPRRRAARVSRSSPSRPTRSEPTRDMTETQRRATADSPRSGDINVSARRTTQRGFAESGRSECRTRGM